MAVPGLGSSLFQTKLDILSSFTALPAPVKLIAKSAMVRPCEPHSPLLPDLDHFSGYLSALMGIDGYTSCW